MIVRRGSRAAPAAAEGLGRLRAGEARLLSRMIEAYCRSRHRPHPSPDGTAGAGSSAAGLGPCPACEELRAYALDRLARCPFGEGKGACSKCRIHCYEAAMRDRVREVMRVAGPLSLFLCPGPALSHLLRSFRPAPARARRGAAR